MPAFDEAATVRASIERVLASPFVGEVVVVDDASRDHTAREVEAISDPRVRLIRQPLNFGKGAALRRGFREVSLPFVVVQDADLEYDPAEYGTLLEPLLRDEADVVFGSRFIGGEERRVLLFWHSAGNKLLTLLSNATTNLNLTDMETCYKVFRREVIRSIDIDEDRFGFEPEVTAKVAQGGWRVYEVPISYDGRTYADGKKIGWRDGVRAVYCILRYSTAPAKHRTDGVAGLTSEVDDELTDSLHNLEAATNYADWIIEHFAPYVHGTVLEVGAGSGMMTSRLRPLATRTIASDLSATRIGELRQRFAGVDDVEILHGDVATALCDRNVDAVVMINVLEHVEDDVGALRQIRDGLAPGGVVALFVPAHQELYSRFDQKVGHFRRYSRSKLGVALAEAGLEVVELRHVNQPGAVMWWLFARILGLSPTSRWTVRLFDRVMVPVVRRMERGRTPRFGQSIIAVARRPD
ncbi:MAG: glycosyltransferase [Ilumatobacteraceae bacterium]